MAKKKNYKYYSSANLEGMTVNQLKDYIREVMGKVVTNLGSKKKSVAAAARNIKEYFGTYRRKQKTYIKLGLSHAKKKTLLEKAQKLRAFSRAVYERKYNGFTDVREKAYNSFNERYSEEYGEISREEWTDLVEMAAGISEIFKDYESDFIHMYYELKKEDKKVKPKTILQVAREVI